MGADEDDAASMIQSVYRMLLARKQFKRMVALSYEKMYDESTNLPFYFNRISKSSSWTVPRFAGKEFIVYSPRSRRRYELQEKKRDNGILKTAGNMTEEQAAHLIQGLYRSRKARLQLVNMVKSIFERVIDENGNVFYFNKQTGQSSWAKPALLTIQEAEALPMTPTEKEKEANQVAEARREKQQQELDAVRAFLTRFQIAEIYDYLVDEGFEDMDSIMAIQEDDIKDLGLKKKMEILLRSALKECRNESYADSDSDESTDHEMDSKSKNGQAESASSIASSATPVDPANQAQEEDTEENTDGDVSDNDSVRGTKEIPGVSIRTVFEGDKKHYPKRGMYALVHYVGSFEDGKIFESSRKRGQPVDFLVGANHVIPGWDKGLRKMSVGERAVFTIAPAMAYGPKGRPPVIPPNATLKFEIELIDTYYSTVGELVEQGSDDEDE